MSMSSWPHRSNFTRFEARLWRAFFSARKVAIVPKFVEAYSKTTGQKQVIPAHWLDVKVAPFTDFSLTPSQKAKAFSSPAVASDSKKEAK